MIPGCGSEINPICRKRYAHGESALYPWSMALRITRPMPGPNGPRVGVAIAVGLVCFAIGVALVRATAVTPAPSAKKAPVAVAPPPLPAKRVARVPRKKVPDGAAQVATIAPSLPAQNTGTLTGLSPEAVANRTLQPAGPTKLRWKPGRVAYLRCEEGPRREPKPCPRDREFEDAVWNVLAAMPEQLALTRGGAADLRMDFRKSPAVVELRKAGDAPLPFDESSQVIQEVGAKIRGIKVKVPTEGLVVSFEFSVDVADLVGEMQGSQQAEGLNPTNPSAPSFRAP